MGVLKLSEYPRHRNRRAHSTEIEQGIEYNPSPSGEGYEPSEGYEPGGSDPKDNQVPGPGGRRKPRKTKRLSPAAVIARSLAPDASALSPVEILARSATEAYAPTYDIPIRAHPDPVTARTPAPEAENADAFETFWPMWMEHQDYLLKQSLRFMSGNMADAEDALSQAMLKASKHYNAETIRNERAWLTRLVHNACMDMYRRTSRQNRISDEICDAPSGELPTIVPPPAPDPEATLLLGQTMNVLQSHLLKLPIKLLEPLVLRCIEEKSYAEIAEAMCISQCLARKRVQHARDQLKTVCKGL